MRSPCCAAPILGPGSAGLTCTASKLSYVAWPAGSVAQLYAARWVLVDHAAEDFAALYRRVQPYGDRSVMVGWPLLAGLVRTMPVVVAGVGSKHRPQVRLAVDQHPVRAFGPRGPHPALGIAICPG